MLRRRNQIFLITMNYFSWEIMMLISLLAGAFFLLPTTIDSFTSSSFATGRYTNNQQRTFVLCEHNNNNNNAINGSYKNDVLVDGTVTTIKNNINTDTGRRKVHKNSNVPKRQQQQQQRSLSPYHILYPDLPQQQLQQYQNQRKLPLHACLDILKQSLLEIINNNNNNLKHMLSTNKDNTNVIRIEHDLIDDSIDVLGWLHKQTKQHSSNKQHTHHTINEERINDDFGFYVHSSIEAAAIGTVWTYGNTTIDKRWTPPTSSSSPSSPLNENNSNNHHSNEFWEFISKLPDSSYVYGAERFDSAREQHNAINNSNEWEEFGTALWFLPAVEMRRTLQQQQQQQEHMGRGNDNSSSGSDDNRKNKNDNFSSNESSSSSFIPSTKLAIHLFRHCDNGKALSSWQEAAMETYQILESITDAVTDSQIPPTAFPPVLYRESDYFGESGKCTDSLELYENGVLKALEAIDGGGKDNTNDNDDDDFDDKEKVKKDDNDCGNNRKEITIDKDEKKEDKLDKVVLARRLNLHFDDDDNLSALDILRKWKYNSGNMHEGGHLFYFSPKVGKKEFFGCAPERLFLIQKEKEEKEKDQPLEKCVTKVISEALAGTRRRGATQQADEELSRNLFASTKDRNENLITGRYISKVFSDLQKRGLINLDFPSHVEDDNVEKKNNVGNFFIRRLRHLQHICQRFSGKVVNDVKCVDVTRYLLSQLHPTPAVCGFPAKNAKDFIRENESIGFDRGYYSGPIGYIGREESDILVGIRSGLLVSSSDAKNDNNFVDVFSSENINSNDDDDGDNDNTNGMNGDYDKKTTKISVYAGAGIVKGSTVRGEWDETAYKLDVVSSLFPQSPINIQEAITPNVAWSTAFIEELIRNGVTQFYICPGSRSTPLAVAIAKAVQSRVGLVKATSIHDERSAAFRAIGYARGSNRPAVVVTSSGTAVANLYPAIIEGAMDGVPLIVLTADRPYENRDTGSNQSIDQVKAFSSSYVRWFRDISPPSDDVPISVALSDANQAVSISRKLRGPVHLNIQFRENLAPSGGAIRNDNRIESTTKFNGLRFVDVPGYKKWSTSGGKWMKSYHGSSITTTTSSSLSFTGTGTGNYYYASPHSPPPEVVEIGRLIADSKRGIIVVGNIRNPTSENEMEDLSITLDVISNFAEQIGFPIIAGAQCAGLRFKSHAVIHYAEYILKNPDIIENLNLDLVIQIGAPLISTEVLNIISKSIMNGEKANSSSNNDHNNNNPGARTKAAQQQRVYHVLLHPHYGQERADPSLSITHKVSSEVSPFLKNLSQYLDRSKLSKYCGSRLSSLIALGRTLQKEIPTIVDEASNDLASKFIDDNKNEILTEPQIVKTMAEVISSDDSPTSLSLFLSASMPVRDAELFLYPQLASAHQSEEEQESRKSRMNKDYDNDKVEKLLKVGANRGASGIDGVISSASGYAEATGFPTSLLIGDVAALHDINAFHSLGSTNNSKYPLTTIIVNNNGGGIFSFLPIAQYGSDVSFDEFFGTPTDNFSFKKGCEAFSLECETVNTPGELRNAYTHALRSGNSSIVEAVVVGREENVYVHKQITMKVNSLIDESLRSDDDDKNSEGNRNDNTIISENKSSFERLPIKVFAPENAVADLPTNSNILSKEGGKTLVLLHGWMGDRTEWDEVGTILSQLLPAEWTIIAVDLPGHGSSQLSQSSKLQSIKSSLGLQGRRAQESSSGSNSAESSLSIDAMAASILKSLSRDYGVKKIDGLAGYSLGGRVALAMKRLSSPSFPSSTATNTNESLNVLQDSCKILLVSAYPGDIRIISDDDNQRTAQIKSKSFDESKRRLQIDDELSREMENICSHIDIAQLPPSSLPLSNVEYDIRWYNFLQRWYGMPIWGRLKDHPQFHSVIAKRSRTLTTRGRDLSSVLRQCSPPRNSQEDWKGAISDNTIFIAGSLDSKYSKIGNLWSRTTAVKFVEIPESGHALLIEAPSKIAETFNQFLVSKSDGNKQPSMTTISESSPASKSKDQSGVVVDASAPVSYDGWEKSEGSSIFSGTIGTINFESFALDLKEQREKKSGGIFGIGWGKKAKKTSKTSQRSGFLIEIISDDGFEVGVGEVSPLSGLYRETLDEAEEQLKCLKAYILQQTLVQFDAAKTLSLDGYVNEYLSLLSQKIGYGGNLLPSVRSGFEMALISLASQVVKQPMHRALAQFAPEGDQVKQLSSFLPINGIITRGSILKSSSVDSRLKEENDHTYPSMKVKVGHQDMKEDVNAILYALSSSNQKNDGENPERLIRLDANRAWGNSQATKFANMLDIEVLNAIEFVEEPLQKQDADDWSLKSQVNALDRWFQETNIPYALDESIADLAEKHDYNFSLIYEEIKNTFEKDREGCVTFVLKPSLLGLELSLRLARKVRSDLGIGAVFSSVFDSGVGLAYAALLGAASDVTSQGKSSFAHGLGTYSMLAGDTLSPGFSSYVSDRGILNIASLSRAFYGLSLDELNDTLLFPDLPEDYATEMISPSTDIGNRESDRKVKDRTPSYFEALTATSSNGREINVVVSLSLPFSADIACARFTDLPQQSRWTPWIQSVKYVDAGRETEWVLNIRGVRIQWRAASSMLESPYRGIRWKSVSGLKNRGVVEFLETGKNTSLMKVHMTVLAPRVLVSTFHSISVFADDFLRDRLLKWSLEMFRDVVKGDLALARGDLELGDALFGAVEGKANAIEATLSSMPGK